MIKYKYKKIMNVHSDIAVYLHEKINDYTILC